ncbi:MULTISPECIES: efflux RND transporter periplasmic adaptor subunit [Rhodanobacter]|uniref:Efflux RND transporter periplasmic adaptor subunit n=1 Tax=Rhodanobacter hydrolyticus TaxID=2250595 RepID=A0ABW8J9D3_9GAMM|nr:efflux RND transporter periplasmic adaptor subunit [Rhodanobacter sp. 7MK24]MBD8882277.1 efflux RND transporter periplasmic adaptor subunit [Rhodanobacter sp. 7MK24]
MSRFWKIALIVVAVVVVALVAVRLLHKPGGAGGPGGMGGDKDNAPVPVTVVPVAKENVPVYLTALGTVQALNTISVNPQVGGQLIKLDFTEGQQVKKGDLLAEIDPRTFQASYDQALAKQKQDEASLSTAQSTLKRNQALVASGYVAALDMDTYRNNVSQLQAAVVQDRAAAESAKVNLDYTRIISPIDGVAGIRAVDPGNVVTTTSTIVTLTQLHPIYVMFTLPEQNLDLVRKAQQAAPLQVAALDRVDAHPVASDGMLQVIDNQIDSTTGTFRLKSQFPNANNALWPGQFVNVRLQVRVDDGALVIPAEAVQRGPDGDYVYQVQGDNTVKMQPVVVAGEVGDSHVMIGSGLKEGEQVVTEGQFRLKPGSKVNPLKPGEVPPAPTEADLKKAKQQGARHGGR